MQVLIILLSMEMTAAAIVLRGGRELLTDSLQMLNWGQEKLSHLAVLIRGRTTRQAH